MYYSPSTPNQYVINPASIPECREGTYIQDVYELQFEWGDDPIPVVKEIGGKIERSAIKWGVQNKADVHLYPDGALCLFPAPEAAILWPEQFSLESFFNKALIPYLYYQSYFEQYGREPWPGASHGFLGLLESYQRIAGERSQSSEVTERYWEYLQREERLANLITLNQIKGHYPCLCGSGKKIRNCHKLAQWGFNRIKRDLKQGRSS